MDVISPKYSNLISSMETLTYHAMLEKHQKVLDQIEIGCFLLNEPILKRINNLIVTINQLLVLITGPRDLEYAESVQDLIRTFDKDLEFLIRVFSGLPEASTLLSRLEVTMN